MPDPTNTPTLTADPRYDVSTHPYVARAAYGGRGSLIAAGLTFALALYITVGLFTMDVADSAQAPGPKFYPAILAVISIVLCIVLTVQVIRKPEHAETIVVQVQNDTDVDTGSAPATHEVAFKGDWKAVVIAVATFLGFALLLEPLGWIISAGAMFTIMAWSLGSKRLVFDIAVGLVVSSAVQVAFSMGLGLNLPSGILGGIF